MENYQEVRVAPKAHICEVHTASGRSQLCLSFGGPNRGGTLKTVVRDFGRSRTRDEVQAELERLAVLKLEAFQQGVALESPVAPAAHTVHPFDRPERREHPSGTRKSTKRRGKGKRKGSNPAEVLVLNLLRAEGWIVRRAGVLDFNPRRGERMCWAEVKNMETGDNLDAGQKAALRHLRRHGIEEYVIDVWPTTGVVKVWTVPGQTPVDFSEVFGA